MYKMNRQPRKDMTRPPQMNDKRETIPVGNLTFPRPKSSSELEDALALLTQTVGELTKRVTMLETKMRLMTRGSRRHMGV